MKKENSCGRKIGICIIFRCQQTVELATATQLKIQGVHPGKLLLIKQKNSQDIINELSSDDEKMFWTDEEKQDCGSGSEDSEAPTTTKRQKTGSAINLVIAAKQSTRKAHPL